MVQNGCKRVGLPLFLLDLHRVGNSNKPLHLYFVIHHVAPLTDHSRVDPLRLWVVGRRGSPLHRHHGGVLELVAKVLHCVASYVVNGFSLMSVMLGRLRNFRPLVRDARP